MGRDETLTIIRRKRHPTPRHARLTATRRWICFGTLRRVMRCPSSTRASTKQHSVRRWVLMCSRTPEEACHNVYAVLIWVQLPSCANCNESGILCLTTVSSSSCPGLHGSIQDDFLSWSQALDPSVAGFEDQDEQPALPAHKRTEGSHQHTDVPEFGFGLPGHLSSAELLDLSSLIPKVSCKGQPRRDHLWPLNKLFSTEEGSPWNQSSLVWPVLGREEHL